jgi:hypothetical protein
LTLSKTFGNRNLCYAVNSEFTVGELSAAMPTEECPVRGTPYTAKTPTVLVLTDGFGSRVSFAGVRHTLVLQYSTEREDFIPINQQMVDANHLLEDLPFPEDTLIYHVAVLGGRLYAGPKGSCIVTPAFFHRV